MATLLTNWNRFNACMLAEDATDVAFCVVNTLATFMYLSQSGTEVASSVEDCPGAFTEDAKVGCAADIWGVLQSFINSGALIAGLVTQCSTRDDLDADCTNAIMTLVGSLAEALEAILSSMGNCPKQQQKALQDVRRLLRRTDSDASDAVGVDDAAARYLGDASPDEPSAEVSGLEAGWCFVDTGSSAVYLAQAGVLIDIGTEDCSNQTNAENEANCAATVSAIIAAIANVASYLAGAAQRCGKTVKLGLCVSDAFSFANGMAGIANAGASLLNTCAKISAEGAQIAGMHKQTKAKASGRAQQAVARSLNRTKR
eukprot:TRINITY_DN21698_c0_g2_i2.p1 TRINITY_DN21698_c0_g2~~TRINITY_DN21698_c0_g2_i2.p1  ORF type:complete len:314 (-),score=70.38 TRINITY_DN21698_c0_g2_i2:56-997(-)